MATTIPASLKSADITRFAHRGAQLEKAKPAAAYWCNYWVLNQILAKNLHNADNDALSYTMALMDKVEQFKSANLNNDAVTDDVAGKAYVEQFGLETFDRADNAVRANKSSRVTADTFQAAATFLDLLTIWGPLDPEISTKSRYAKFHAIRILKAIKAGEDPNASNPKPEPMLEESLPQLDPEDAEVKALEGGAPNPRRASVVEVLDEADRVQADLARTSSIDQSLHPSREQSLARPPRPSVTEVPDEAHRIQSSLARTSSKDESLHPSRATSQSRTGTGAVSPLAPQDDASAFYTSNQPDISPMESTGERKPSIGGNYFPLTSNAPPTSNADLPLASQTFPPDSSLNLPTAPSEPSLLGAPNTFTHGPAPPVQAPVLPPDPGLPSHFEAPQPPPTVPFSPDSSAPPFSIASPHQTTMNRSIPPQPPVQPPIQQRSQASFPPAGNYMPPPSVPTVVPQARPQPPPPPPTQPAAIQNQAVVDEEAILKAQKHARWAISALNFEDVPTAIRELQGALAVLGAR